MRVSSPPSRLIGAADRTIGLGTTTAPHGLQRCVDTSTANHTRRPGCGDCGSAATPYVPSAEPTSPGWSPRVPASPSAKPVGCQTNHRSRSAAALLRTDRRPLRLCRSLINACDSPQHSPDPDRGESAVCGVHGKSTADRAEPSAAAGVPVRLPLGLVECRSPIGEPGIDIGLLAKYAPHRAPRLGLETSDAR